jgi:riboflavin kinase/FMN adenylyltransferase
MKIYNGLAEVDVPFDRAVVTLGNFDGMHLGHRTIISEAVKKARELDGTSVTYTFYPHPVKMLAPDACPPLIQTLYQRLESIEALGMDACVVESFNLNLAQLPPKDFFNHVLIEKLGAKAVVVGYDFTFGVHRRGTVDLMKQMGESQGVSVDIIEAQFMDELLISSTEIRRDVATGNVERAQELMGEPFTLRGKVVSGRGIGGSLGAHTANIEVENELMPLEGVYLTRTRLPNEEKSLPSVASVGVNPTFEGSSFTVETHIIDFEGILQGKMIELLFYKRVRGQIEFDSAETLRGQIERDIEAARRWHEDHGI